MLDLVCSFVHYINMQRKTQRPWAAIRDDINAKLEQFDGTPKSLSERANIDYYAARRIINDKVTNKTRSAISVAKALEIETDISAKVQISLGDLEGLIAKVWDGTEPHAELLMKLIKSTKPFKVEDRSK